MGGNRVLDADVRHAYLDRITQRIFCVELKDDSTLFLDLEGNTLLTAAKDDTHFVGFNDSENLYSYVKSGSDKVYFSLKDQDYTISGNLIGGTFVSHPSSDGKRELIDWLTGDVLLQGYDKYQMAHYSDGENWYVIAFDERANTATLYKLSN